MRQFISLSYILELTSLSVCEDIAQCRNCEVVCPGCFQKVTEAWLKRATQKKMRRTRTFILAISNGGGRKLPLTQTPTQRIIFPVTVNPTKSLLAR